MALFGKKKEATPAAAPGAQAATAARALDSLRNSAAEVILRPRITEKATDLTGSNVYTFEVRPEATKQLVAQAIRDIYKVTPVKVNIVSRKKKPTRVRGRSGVKRTPKKAYVFLKEGERIELV